MFRTLSVSTRSTTRSLIGSNQLTRNALAKTHSGRVVKPVAKLNPRPSGARKARKARKASKPRLVVAKPVQRFVFDSVGVLPMGTVAVADWVQSADPDPLSIWRSNLASREYSPDISASSSPRSEVSDLTEFVWERDDTPNIEAVVLAEPIPERPVPVEPVAVEPVPVEPVPVEPVPEQSAPAEAKPTLILPKWGEAFDLLGNRGIARPVPGGKGNDFTVNRNQLLLCGVRSGANASKVAIAGRTEKSPWLIYLPQYGPTTAILLQNALAQEILAMKPMVARPDLGADYETMLRIWFAISDHTPTRPPTPVSPLADDDVVMDEAVPEVAEPVQCEPDSPSRSDSPSTVYFTDGEDCDRDMTLPSPNASDETDYAAMLAAPYEQPEWVYSHEA